MTWLELIDFIEKSVVNKNENVKVFDLKNNQEYQCDFIEFSEDQTWQPLIAINLEILDKE